MNVLYTKFNRERLPRFQIMTQVFEEYGRMYSRKKALTVEAHDHIKRVGENTVYFNGKVISSSDSEIVTEYNRNTSLTTLLMTALKNGDDSRFRKIIGEYTRFMYRGTERDSIFIQTDEFINVFGYLERPIKNINCFEKSNVDMNFDNLFANLNYKGNSPRFESIDCEWVFDFKVPVEYVIFRAMLCFSNEYRSFLHEYPFEKLLEIAGVRAQNIKNYWSFERNFSRYVFGNDNIYVKRQYCKEKKAFNEVGSSNQWELKVYIPDDGYMETNTIIKMIDFGAENELHTLNISRPVKGKFRIDLGDTPAVAAFKSIKLSKLGVDGSISYSREFSIENKFDGIILKNGIFEIDRQEDLIAVIYNNDPHILIDDEIETLESEIVSITLEMRLNNKLDESIVMSYQKKIEALMDEQRNEYSKALLELNDKLLSTTSQYYTINHEYNLANTKIAEIESENREWNEKYYDLNHQHNLVTFKVTELENEKLDMTNKYLTANHEKNLAENKIVEMTAQLERERVDAKNERLRLDNEINICNIKLAEAAIINDNLRTAVKEHEAGRLEMQDQIRSLERAHYTLQQNYNTLEQHYRALEQGNKALEQGNKTLEQALQVSNEHVRNLQESIRTIYSSGSWKLTEPYRALKKLVTGKNEGNSSGR